MSQDGQFAYPALYNMAGQLSAQSQGHFLNLIRAEYLFLLITSVFALDLSDSKVFLIAYAFVFLLSLGVSIARSWQKPEQDWYKGRALAESIKTSAWRYCMGADPFSLHETLAKSRSEFRNHLRAILEANRHIGERIPADSAADDQITPSMDTLRDSCLDDRKKYYEKFRIREQRSWYANKAKANRRASRVWQGVAVAVYLIAILSVLLRLSFPDHKIWFTESLAIIASSVVGWTQVKRFNELASSYILTAHEIGLLQDKVREVETEETFSMFINEAEQAFSREHTQWVARQQDR